MAIPLVIYPTTEGAKAPLSFTSPAEFALSLKPDASDLAWLRGLWNPTGTGMVAGLVFICLMTGMTPPAFAEATWDKQDSASQFERDRNDDSGRSRNDDSRRGEVTLIQIGDLHGHMVPRPNLRSDAIHKGEMEGGLARIYTLIQRIRRDDPRALLVNTGDTVQGSAEALFTRGQAMVDVLDKWNIGAFAFGNWDFLYGQQRTFQLWGKGTGPNGVGHRWGA